MKNLSLFIAVILCSFSMEFQAQEVPEVQRPLISKVAATWCPPCGGWGWTFFDNLILDNEDQATFLVAHHSGDLFNETSKAFSDNFDAPYQPYFYLNIADQQVTAANAAEKRAEVKAAVEAESMSSPIANSSIKAAIDQFLFIVELETKFFQDTTGDFYVGAYVVESGVVNFQEGQGDNAIHEKILQASFTDDAFGEALINGAVEAGDSWKMTFDIPVSYAGDLEHLEVISIIWNKIDDTYFPVNSAVAAEIEVILSAPIDFKSDINLVVSPTRFSQNAQVELELISPLKNATLEVVDVNGRLIHEIYQGALNAGRSSFAIDRAALDQAGLYFLTLNAADQIISRKLIVE